MSNHVTTYLLTGAMLSLVGACSSGHLNPGSPLPHPPVPAASLPSEGVSAPRSTEFTARSLPTDGNIAAILLAANNTGISYAQLAQSRAQSPAVKDFAQRMLADDAAVNELLAGLLSTTELVAVDNRESLSFRDASAAKRDILRKLEGPAFDTTYMSNEVSYHAQFLQSIDRDLQVLAANPYLRQLISDIRPKVAAHLADAQQLRTALTESK